MVRSNVCVRARWARMERPTGRYRLLLEKKDCREHPGLLPSPGEEKVMYSPGQVPYRDR